MIAVFIFLAIIAEIIGTVGGFGSSLFFVPLAQFFFDIKTVLGITAIFHVFSNIVKLILFRKTIDWKLSLLYGIPSVIFVLLGAWLTTIFSFRFDQITLGLFLIFFSSLLLYKPDLKLAANPTSSCFGCLCDWDIFGEQDDRSRGRSVCVSCLSGTAFPGYFQFQACPAHPHYQEQESQVWSGVEQNKNHDAPRRCDSWGFWGNGTLPSAAPPTTGWSRK